MLRLIILAYLVRMGFMVGAAGLVIYFVSAHIIAPIFAAIAASLARLG